MYEQALADLLKGMDHKSITDCGLWRQFEDVLAAVNL